MLGNRELSLYIKYGYNLGTSKGWKAGACWTREIHRISVYPRSKFILSVKQTQGNTLWRNDNRGHHCSATHPSSRAAIRTVAKWQVLASEWVGPMSIISRLEHVIAPSPTPIGHPSNSGCSISQEQKTAGDPSRDLRAKSKPTFAVLYITDVGRIVLQQT